MHKTDKIAKADSRSHASVFSPLWDFVFVGGLTFVFFPFVLTIDHDISALLTLTFVMYAATFFLNGPHFLYSYQILYSDFWRKLGPANHKMSRIRYFFSGVVVPAILMVMFAVAYYHGVTSGSADALGYIINIMLFFVGWHYVKQGYGVLITLSVKKRVFYNAFEKKLLLYNGYLVWIVTWIFSNGKMARAADTYYDVPFKEIAIADDFIWLAYICAFSSAIVILTFVMRAHRGQVSWNGWTGYFCALYGWTGLIVLQPAMVIVIPALHSLQYMLFVGKLSFEKGREPERVSVMSGFVGFLALGVILSSLYFWLLPYSFDRLVPYDSDVFGGSLFWVMLLVFMNIHHYFIDFAIWRKDNPDMQYLYR